MRGVVCSLVVAGVVGCVGCGANEAIVAADDFDDVCAFNSDCVIVTFGDACEACFGELAPISRAEIPAWQDAVDEAIASCGSWTERHHAECIVPTPQIAPECVDGVCVLVDDGAACTFEGGFCVGVDPVDG